MIEDDIVAATAKGRHRHADLLNAPVHGARRQPLNVAIMAFPSRGRRFVA